MSRRNSRSNGLRDPVTFLEKMRPAREAVIDEIKVTQINGPHYHMLQVLLSAIDVAAQFFSGDRHYFLNRNPDRIGFNVSDDA